MNYQIKLIEVEGTAGADGVYVNRDGAWLGEVDGDMVRPYFSMEDEGEMVPAPENWRELIIKEL